MSRLPEHPEMPDLRLWLEQVSADLTVQGINRVREAAGSITIAENWIHELHADLCAKAGTDPRLLKLEIEWEEHRRWERLADASGSASETLPVVTVTLADAVTALGNVVE